MSVECFAAGTVEDRVKLIISLMKVVRNAIQPELCFLTEVSLCIFIAWIDSDPVIVWLKEGRFFIVQGDLMSFSAFQINVILREKSLSGGSFGTQLQFGSLSGTVWQNLLQEGNFLAAHWVPVHGVSFLHLAPVATQPHIKNETNLSYCFSSHIHLCLTDTVALLAYYDTQDKPLTGHYND